MSVAMTVGTADKVSYVQAVGAMVRKKNRKTKWHCHCLLMSGKEVFIVQRAETAAEASEKVHEVYAKTVEYVLDILSEEQMRKHQNTFRGSIIKSQDMIY